jgi:hypothetical protein
VVVHRCLKECWLKQFYARTEIDRFFDVRGFSVKSLFASVTQEAFENKRKIVNWKTEMKCSYILFSFSYSTGVEIFICILHIFKEKDWPLNYRLLLVKCYKALFKLQAVIKTFYNSNFFDKFLFSVGINVSAPLPQFKNNWKEQI